ncbi:adenosylmethionine decarboxylase [Nonlabens sp.]|uniref:adenosylmethionine decarboxylase n=1 Tax=Nonlabens sp. TaxID=1888209 RepID=UPI003F695543
MRSTHLGYQKTIDLYGCNTATINSRAFIEETLLEASALMNLTIVNFTFHEFSPIGISGVIVIEESHLTFHSWPEHDYVAIDIFTCNSDYDLTAGIEFLKKKFDARELIQEDAVRGNLSIVERLNSNR